MYVNALLNRCYTFAAQLLAAIFCCVCLQVSTLNPSFHRTAIVNNVNDAFIKLYRNLSPEVQAEYGETFLQVHTP